MKKFIVILSLLAIFGGITMGCLGITGSYFSNSHQAQYDANSGTLEMRLNDAASVSAAIPLGAENLLPYEKTVEFAKIKNTGTLPFLWAIDFNKLDNGNLSDVLKTTVSVEMTLLFYLRKAEESRDLGDNDGYKDWLNQFIAKVNQMKTQGLIGNNEANQLTEKAGKLKAIN
jgi:hypothetical protein